MWKKFGDFAVGASWQARQDILQISEGVMAIKLGGLDQAHDGGARWPARRLPAKSQFFRPVAIGRMQFSIQLLSMGT